MEQETSKSMPSEKQSEIDNRFIWLLSALQFLWPLVLYFKVELQVIFITFVIINTVLVFADRSRLMRAGYEKERPSILLALFLTPLYVIWRAYKFRKKTKYYCVLVFFISIVVSTMIGNDILDQQSLDQYNQAVDQYNKSLEQVACPTVTEIYNDKLNMKDVSCKVVKIDEKVIDGFYRAHAILNNGNSIKISIEIKSDQIYVTIPNQ